ncbi:hypothetical protein GPEL0_01f1931 [Geoanaerobacter pelophilus]|uniref:Uncharacterized protein n=1 Tax=Geoanaerobacter pelophilus TaxID=60036 RepID=A0ABQ0MK29_9BACT|nr:hypothetical protein GPEL0_01f1931 [Geoanaerobacter pelophilus]
MEQRKCAGTAGCLGKRPFFRDRRSRFGTSGFSRRRFF